LSGNNWLKPTPTPQNQIDRERIQQDTDAFLERGGEIKHIPKGVSSWDEDAIEFMAKKIRSRKHG